MKVLTNQTIYQCEYCGKRLLSKNGAKTHEENWCKNEDPPNQLKIKIKQAKCSHKNVDYRYRTMVGEDFVQEPDYKICLDCGLEPC